jgi:hypothetical protein
MSTFLAMCVGSFLGMVAMFMFLTVQFFWGVRFRIVVILPRAETRARGGKG